MNASALLTIEDLHVSFHTANGVVPVLNGVSLALRPGESLALVGESGSGKSVTARTVTGLLPDTATDVRGSVILDGTQIVGLKEGGFRRLRGQVVSMIFQDPMRSLNPTMRIGAQLAEAINAHRKRDKRATQARAQELLELVQIPAAKERLRAYPHELSGGLRQRVMIAMALAGEPKLLIADEPTTALDVTIQAQVLDLLDDLRRELHMALILVTHDLSVAAERTDRVAVMYAGSVVESAPTSQLLGSMRMPYTRALVDSVPAPGLPRHSLLPAIGGRPPLPGQAGPGCPFEPRCPKAAQLPPTQRERCITSAPEVSHSEGHTWRCWYPLDGGPDVLDGSTGGEVVNHG